ncbi:MAG: kynureninase, partial [Gemmatimonadales bacterium]
LMESWEFPSDTYAVRSHLAGRGVDPDADLLVAHPRPGSTMLETGAIEALLEQQGEEIALICMSAVNYYTGQLLDLERITAAAHRHGCLAGFDLAHAAGNVPLRLHEWGVDFAVWCSYKYLNAGPGAVAGAFVHERHGNAADTPRLAGWWGNDPATRFRMHLNETFTPRPGADGWQLSNPPVLALAPLVASLAIFDEAEIPRLRDKSHRLTGYLEYLIDRIPGSPFEIITPRDPDARGCQLSLRVKRGGRTLFDRLQAGGVLGDFREPDVIRLAPVPLYNSFTDVWRAGQVLEAVSPLP